MKKHYYLFFGLLLGLLFSCASTAVEEKGWWNTPALATQHPKYAEGDLYAVGEGKNQLRAVMGGRAKLANMLRTNFERTAKGTTALEKLARGAKVALYHKTGKKTYALLLLSSNDFIASLSEIEAS